MQKKIVWLCSWYPNEEDPFIGDFIQRHAWAVSAFAHIHVIHIREATTPFPSSVKTIHANLTEEIHYLDVKQVALLRTLAYMRKQIACLNHYIKQHGKPHGIHVHVPMKAGIVALHAKWYLRIPYVVTEHYGIYNNQVIDHFGTRTTLFRYLSRHIVHQSKQLTTVSKNLAQEMQAAGLDKHTSVIANVVDTNLFQYTPPPTMQPFRFIHVSGMSTLKNVEGILDAFEILCKTHSEVSLELVGDIREHLQHRVQQSALLSPRVQFSGVLPYSAVAKRMQQAHAFVLFSDSESQSCVVLEALCCGRPCIVPATGGVQELIDDSNGFLVEVRNTAMLMEQLKNMIARYSQFDTTTIAEVAAARYSYNSIGQSFANLYEEHFI